MKANKKIVYLNSGNKNNNNKKNQAKNNSSKDVLKDDNAFTEEELRSTSCIVQVVKVKGVFHLKIMNSARDDIYIKWNLDELEKDVVGDILIPIKAMLIQEIRDKGNSHLTVTLLCSQCQILKRFHDVSESICDLTDQDIIDLNDPHFFERMEDETMEDDQDDDDDSEYDDEDEGYSGMDLRYLGIGIEDIFSN